MDAIVRLGRGPLVVVAPHGGTSARDLLEPPDRPVRSNDLHTADLALQLAERVDASLVANGEVDRNRVDLNRIDEVATRAPWLFEKLAELVDGALAAHGRAEVFFVHGWHVVQPRCDVGVGARFASVRAAPTDRLTVGERYLRDRLDVFREACLRIGVDAAFGDRWPGAHPNNVLQVFRRSCDRGFEGAAGRLAAAARSGRVEAVQLELGAALRWPGAPREAFVDAFAATLGSPAAASRRESPADDVAERGRGTDERRALGLRLFDPASGPAGLGLVAGVGPMPGGRLGGRLLLFPGSQRLVLFTGEQRGGPAGSVGALRVERDPDGLRLGFRGHALAAPDARDHFRSERAQLRARVVPVSVDVRLDDAGHGFGLAVGRVEIDGEVLVVKAGGFSGVPWGGGVDGPPLPETRVATATDRAEGLSFRVRDGLLAGFRHGAPGAPAEPVRGVARRPGSRPGELDLEVEGGPLRFEPRCHLAWLRSGPDGRHATVTVGVLARDPASGAPGGGIFEHVEPRESAPREKTGLPAGSKVP
ncbi:hypothetical protein KGQ64_00720 [bacterium]|nr:hypothetical protein [bacterium]